MFRIYEDVDKEVDISNVFLQKFQQVFRRCDEEELEKSPEEFFECRGSLLTIL